MNGMALSTTSFFAEQEKETELDNLRSRWIAVLSVSAVLGVAAGLAGLMFSSVTWFFNDATKGVAELGTILVVAFLPLLMLAAHSLDKIREAEKALRLDYCRRHGLKYEDCEPPPSGKSR